ncbi:MAG: hypothetical protein ACI8QF_001908 [Limisphaerales bacterium]|jgi:hypothetical protein
MGRKHWLLLPFQLMRKPWLTLESVQQDLQAAVLVANLENLLSQEAQEQLSAGDRQRQYPLRVNKAVSYHALKERIFDLLMNRRGTVDEALSQLQLWMKNSPVSRRIGRQGPERKKSLARSCRFQRTRRKNVF